jgi:hypothetical protein
MAYSNWGGFVYRDGVRRTDREDVAVFNDEDKDLPSGARIFANIQRNMARHPGGNYPWYEHSHHVVLGDGMVRLCGYKRSPELWYAMDPGDIRNIGLDQWAVRTDEYGEACEWQGCYEGCEFHIGVVELEHRGTTYELLGLSFRDEDGTPWTGACGMEFGAGWMDVDPTIEMSDKTWWVPQ